MRIIFMGTPDFAVPCLEALVKSGEEILGVITQPDRPKGRGKQLNPSPVKVKATEYGVPVYQPERIKTPEFVSLLKGIQPELIVVVAFGQLLSPEILNLPPYGCVNVHASLLPNYRGAAPIHRAVLNGEKTTGVTTMYMDQGLDTGDMILCHPIPITPEDTVGTIHDKLAELGAQLLLKTIEGIKLGQAPRKQQDNDKATYAEMLRREHELIDWGRGAEQLWNQIRGMNPWPGAYTLWEDKVLKVWKAEVWTPERDASGGTDFSGEEVAKDTGKVIKIIPGRGLVVQTGQGQLLVQEIQLQGSRRLRVEEFIRGHNISVGTSLG